MAKLLPYYASWLLVFDTNQYTGTFERQMCAYVTGVLGQGQVGFAEANEALLDFGAGGSPFAPLMDSTDVDESPVVLWRARDTEGEYISLALLFAERPPPELCALAGRRAYTYTMREGIGLLGMRLMQQQVLTTQEALSTTPLQTHTPRLHALSARLAPLAAQAQVQREHWIHGSDESLSYCAACAEVQLAALLHDEPDGDYAVDGGHEVHEHDSGEYCDTCHIKLEYTLSDWGAGEELGYFLTDPPSVITPEVAYELCAVLDAYDGVAAPPALRTLLAWMETMLPPAQEEPTL
jgi:hypothetical protein